MSATMLKGARRILAVGGAVVVGSGAAYYISQSTVVAALEREREDLETKVFVSQGKARRADSDALEAEALITALRQQAELDSSASAEIGTQLDSLRAQVQQLEAQQQQRQESATRARKEAVETAEKLQRLREEAARFKSEAAAADQKLGAAAAEVAAARARMSNPLRHPLFQQWRSGGQ